MKLKIFIIFVLALTFSFSIFYATVSAEDKNTPAGMIPKLPQTPNDPELINGRVYPSWGPPCQRYTYSVIYADKKGRKPEYMKIYFNGRMIEMQKENPLDNDYKKGVQYIYKFTPNKLGSNFYYFEASNGLGKARASIIDSPDNGPVLFESAFNKNEIAVIDSKTGKKVLSYPTKEEWVGGVALSDDGKYLAAKTSNHVYLLDTQKPGGQLWEYKGGSEVGGDVKGGIAISGDGSRIFALIGSVAVLFDKTSNKPLWKVEVGNGYNVAISKDGKYMAAALAGSEENENSNLLILWSDKSEKSLWQYHSSGNFHDVSLSQDGQFVSGSTGCPDRRFYVFSRDSNTPLVKSEMLTRDSPVHRAKISADGSLAAVGSESDAGAVFLFKTNSKEPIWKFPTQNGSSVRALNFTPDGKYIGAATFGGDAYIFEKDTNIPVANWKLNTSLGGLDIADNGSFIAVGGTDKKLHIFKKGSQTGIDVLFDEYVEEIDISGNGKYIAAGTGGSVYFFESINNDNKIFPCTTIIEPKSPFEAMSGNDGQVQQVSSSLCGNGKCEGPETIENCKQDCSRNFKTSAGKLQGMIFGFGLLGSVLMLGLFTALRKLKFLENQKKIILKLTGKKVTLVLITLTILFLIFTIIAILFNRNPDAALLEQSEQPGKAIMNQEQEPVLNGSNQESGICGNNICEPGLGESKEICPQDCSGGN